MYKAFRISGTEYTVSEIMDLIRRDKVFFGNDGGITISGGEALSQGEFTKEVFRLCKEDGISTVLDTSAYGDTGMLKGILEYTDLVLLDIKHMDPEVHKKWTGVSNELILKNARIIAGSTPVRISIPLIAEVNDSPENLEATARFALENRIEHIDIDPIHFLGKGKYKYLGKRQPYNVFRLIENEEVRTALDIFRQHGLKADVGRMM